MYVADRLLRSITIIQLLIYAQRYFLRMRNGHSLLGKDRHQYKRKGRQHKNGGEPGEFCCIFRRLWRGERVSHQLTFVYSHIRASSRLGEGPGDIVGMRAGLPTQLLVLFQFITVL